MPSSDTEQSAEAEETMDTKVTEANSSLKLMKLIFIGVVADADSAALLLLRHNSGKIFAENPVSKMKRGNEKRESGRHSGQFCALRRKKY